MKKGKKIFIPIIIIIIVVAGISLVIFYLHNRVSQTMIKNRDFFEIKKVNPHTDDKKNYVYTNADEFKQDYLSEEITDKNFKNYNYVLIPIEYTPCNEKNVTPVDYTVKGNNIDVTIHYTKKCEGVCSDLIKYYALQVEKNITKANVTIHSKKINEEACDEVVEKKPIIYLYPQEEQEIIVRLGHEKLIKTSYPKYNREWIVTATPDGTLKDKKNDRFYYGLYWEGNGHKTAQTEEGFVVKREEIIPFLEKQLAKQGLTDREANEFIIFWLPELEKNDYNYIRFETIEEINNYMPLEITPKPDTIIRVYMQYKGLKEKINVKSQNFVTPNRKGFTVVEWGGSKIGKDA